MSSTLAEDFNASLNLMCSYWLELKSLDPNNESLKFVKRVEKDYPTAQVPLAFSDENWPEFIERFGKSVEYKKFLTFCNYYQALRNEIRRIKDQKIA